MFKEFLSDPTGQFSMMRGLSALIVIASMSVWIMASIKASGMVDIPENIMYLNASTLLGKSIQKGFEK